MTRLRALLADLRDVRGLRAENAALDRALVAEHVKYVAACQALKHYMPDCNVFVVPVGDHERR